MMKSYILLISNLLFWLVPALAQDKESDACSSSPSKEATLLPLAIGLHNMHTGADAAYLRSVINPTSMKGVLGESLAEEVYLNRSLSKGHWQRLSPRWGPQGLDHVFIKTDSAGHPCDILLAESKYDSSTLGDTKDGIQMSERWRNRRLLKMGERYLSASTATEVGYGALPLSARQSLSLHLSDGTECHFWRMGAKNAWNFTGTARQLEEAQRITGEYGKFIKSAGLGQIRTRQKIFHSYPNKGDLVIDVLKLEGDPTSRTLSNLPIENRVILKDALITKGNFTEVAKREFAVSIQRKTGLSDEDSLLLSKETLGNLTPNQGFQKTSVLPHAARHLGIATAIGGALDLGLQVSSGEWSPTRNALTLGGTLLGGVVGYGASEASVRFPSYRRTLKTMHIRPKFAAGMSAAAAAEVVIDYGLFLTGDLSLEEANRSAVAGLGGTAAGAAAGAALLSTVSAFATAGTGTAISTLGGAAATNASLAWLGGGSVATGGLGMGVGTAVVGGVVTLVGFAAVAGIYEAFEMYDQSQERKRVDTLMNFYAYDSNWETNWLNILNR